MKIYTCMTVAGSIPVLVCLLLWLFQKHSYDFRMGRRLLLAGLFFYLVPFQMIKFILPEKVTGMLHLPLTMNQKQNFYQVVSVTNILSPDESIWVPRWLSVLGSIWLCVVICFAVYQVVKYRMDIRRLLAQSEKVSVEIEGKTVELLMNRKIHSLYTVGFIRQSILVPEESLNHPCFPMFYRHEEQHRKNHDSLMKLLCIGAICIHGVNPASFLLLVLYSMTAEYLCDEKATEGCTEEEKKQYLTTLIQLSTEKEPLSMVWKNNLSGSEKRMKRRINYMMKKRKKGMMKKAVAAAAAVLTMFGSASTILAYEPYWSTDDSVFETYDGSEIGMFSDEDNTGDYDFSVSDRIFIYEDGTQVAITDDEIVPHALCNHTMTNGYYSYHKSNSSGGCTVTVYKAKRCTKCTYTEIGDYYATTTYATCPH
ncbi:MAG: M56 family metallopeptidase [Blautia sp.]